jgi:hypothetical protein
MVVAALRQRRIRQPVSKTQNRPAKPGGFCLSPIEPRRAPTNLIN